MNAIGVRLYELNFGRPKIASREMVRDLLTEAASAVEGHKFSLPFLLTEWKQVVDAWQLESWESYRDVVRLGRKTRLKEAQRIVLWSIFERVRSALKARGLVTYSEMFSRVAAKLRESAHGPFGFAVVDEAQDVSVPQLRFLAALGGGACTACSSPATWASGFFSSRSLGRRLVSMFAGVRPRCASTTGPPTRSESKQTGYWGPKCPTWTAIRKIAGVQSLPSMAHHRTSWSSIILMKKSRQSANG